MKNMLIIVHSDHYEDSLTSCKNYDEVAAFFIAKFLRTHGYTVQVVPGQRWLGTKKIAKSTMRSFDNHFDKQLVNQYHNVMFVGAVPLKICSPQIVDWFKKHVKGLMIEFGEYRRGAKRDLQFFCLPGDETTTDYCVGPMYDGSSLYPDKQYSKLVLHIDHHLPGRGDCHLQIIEKIKELSQNQMFKDCWNGYELYYHGIKLNNIEDLDFYNKPPNIPFANLSAIYRKTHVGFLSHRETMGLYPVELAACGSVVAVFSPEFMPPSMYDIITVEFDSDDFWDKVLTNISPQYSAQIQQRMLPYSYEQGVAKMVKTIQQHARWTQA